MQGKKQRKRYRRLDRAERAAIQSGLDKGRSCRQMARDLDRSPSTVADEVARAEGLTDRGSEFLDFKALERSVDGGRRCSVYYCDPLQSGQKGRCEKNHVELRKVLPKGTCFEGITNYELSVICSHVNSYTRPALGGAAPIDIAGKILPADLLDGLAIEKIDPDEVVMRPSLLVELGLR